MPKRPALPLPRLSMAALLCLALAACDPNYCGVVYGKVRTPSGQPAPANTRVTFYFPRGLLADSSRFRDVIDSVYTVTGGDYTMRLQLFIQKPTSIGIEAGGRDTIAAIRTEARCRRPPRTRVNLTIPEPGPSPFGSTR